MKSMKKLLTLIFAISCLQLWALEGEVNGIMYRFDETLFNEAEVISRNGGYTGSVDIPSQVTYNNKLYTVSSIGSFAFQNCDLTSISIPVSVAEIGDYAFSNCSISVIYLPQYLSHIGNNVFYNCKNLTSVTIHSSVSSIGERAFFGCSSLSSITIPSSTTSIGNYAFGSCTGLTSVSISNSVTSIGASAFEGCTALSSVTLGNSVQTIGAKAFKNCKTLSSINIPNTVTSIDDEAFNGCVNLSSVHISDLAAWCRIRFTYIRPSYGVIFPSYDANPLSRAHHLYLNGTEVTDLVIPNTVTSIGAYAFAGCTAFTSVTIPASVTSVGDEAFYGCNSLTSVHITDLAAWCSIYFGDNPLEYAHHLYLNGTEVTDLVIPNTVTNIGNYAFVNDKSITSVSIPSSVTSIGEYAFRGCSNLTSVMISEGVTSIGGDAFAGCGGITSVYISDLAAWCRIKFNEIIIPGSINVIDPDTYFGNPLCYAEHLYLNGSEIEDLVIPASVTSIGKYAFLKFSGFTSMTIPSSVTSIGLAAFYNCSGLTSITCEATTPPTCDSQNFMLMNKSIPVYVPCESVSSYKTATGWNLFSNIQSIDANCEEPSDFSITVSAITHNQATVSVVPASTTSYFCNVLAKSTYDALVAGEYYGSVAGLVNVYLSVYGSGITDIGNSTYTYTELQPNTEYVVYAIAVDVDNLQAVGEPDTMVFTTEPLSGQCGDNLYWSIEDSELTITGTGAMYDYNRNTNPWNAYPISSISLPEGMTYIGDYAFYDCSNLTAITIPDSVASIGWYAFTYCSDLTSIVCEATTPPVCADSCFADVPASISVYVPCAALEAYQTADVWSAFTKFQIIEGSTCNDEPLSGQCGYDLYWLYENGTLTIIGTGNMYDYSYEYQAPWASLSISAVSFPDDITHIGDYAFMDCANLSAITIPNSVTSIGEYAFGYCTSLTSVTIPNSMTSIAHRAFSGCSGLTSVTLPNSLENIGDGTFAACSSLTSITIPSTVTSLGSYAFTGCLGLTSITCETMTPPMCGIDCFSSVPATIPIYVMCGSVEAYLSTSEWNKFTNFQAIEGTCPSSFPDNQKLYYTSSDGHIVDSYRASAFGANIISNSYIDGQGCLVFDTVLTTIGINAFSRCVTLTSVIIPDGVTSIERRAFARCDTLTSVTIPNSVTSIGENAFEECYSLVSVTIPNSVTSIGVCAFGSCYNLSSILLSESLTKIESNVFQNCNSLTSVVIPESVTGIGRAAFQFCSNLTSVTIGSSVTDIANQAFELCVSLASITCKAINPPTCSSMYCFNVVPTLIPIYVPCESVEAYQVAFGWSNFTNIQAIEGSCDEETPISLLHSEKQSESAAVKIIRNGQIFILRGEHLYDLSGVEVK